MRRKRYLHLCKRLWLSPTGVHVPIFSALHCNNEMISGWIEKDLVYRIRLLGQTSQIDILLQSKIRLKVFCV